MNRLQGTPIAVLAPSIQAALTLIMVFSVCSLALGQTPLDNHFTYQGQIKQNGTPFNGSCNFIFSLYAGSVGGSVLGATFDAPGIAVANGLFTAQLEFAANAFNGEKRWLEIQAQCPAGTGVLTTLSPRQELTAAPYAAYALQAGGGAVASVTASAPLTSSGGTTPNISFTGILPIANGGTGSATQNFVDLSTTQAVSGVKTFANAPVFAAVGTPFSVSNTGLVTNLNSDLLDGQHAAFYQNATNILAGTLSTDRFSAYADLLADSKIGAAAGMVAAGDHLHDNNYYTQAVADARFVNKTAPDTIAGSWPSALLTVNQTGTGPAANFSAASNNGIYASSAGAVGSNVAGVRGDGGYVGVWGQASAANTYGVMGLNTGSGTAAYFRSTSGTSLHVDGTALISGNVTVNGATSMTGNLTVPQVLYAPAKVDYFSLAGDSFQPATDVAYGSLSGNGGAYIASGTGAMLAPVHLPHGAIVTEFKAFFYDNSASDLVFTLFRMPLPAGSYYQMATVTTSGTPGYSSLAATTVAYNPIDNSSNGYLVHVWCNAWTGGDVKIMGVSIKYTISEAH